MLVIPAAAAVLLALLPGYWLSARLNVLASLATWLTALTLLVERPAPSPYLFVDDLNIVFVVLATFVGFTTSAFSASYIGHEREIGKLTPRYLRFYHAMYQTLMFAMNLALVANNIGLMWVAIEIATLTTVLMVGIYRTHEALEAAWKYFILGSVGIALALFGTILVYMAARPVLGEGQDAMVWTALIAKAGGFAPELLNVAFVFLMLGYGTKVGLAPLHAWLPDAHAEGPDAHLCRAFGSPPQRGALCAAALQDAARRQSRGNSARSLDGDNGSPLPDLRRLHALPPARHQTHVRLLLHRAHGAHHLRLRHGRAARQLCRPAAHEPAFAHQVGDLLRRRPHRPGQGHAALIRDPRPHESHPVLGWGLVLGVVAIAGLPPLGLFMSEFLIVSSTFARAPLLAILLVLGLLIAFGALMLRLSEVAFGEPIGSTAPVKASYVPLFAHLALVAGAGIYLPGPLVPGSKPWPGCWGR